MIITPLHLLISDEDLVYVIRTLEIINAEYPEYVWSTTLTSGDDKKEIHVIVVQENMVFSIFIKLIFAKLISIFINVFKFSKTYFKRDKCRF